MQALEENLGAIQRDLNDLLDCSYDVDFLIKKMEDDYSDWLDAADLRLQIQYEEMYRMQMRINAEMLAKNQTLITFIHINNIHIQSMLYLMQSLRK